MFVRTPFKFRGRGKLIVFVSSDGKFVIILDSRNFVDVKGVPTIVYPIVAVGFPII